MFSWRIFANFINREVSEMAKTTATKTTDNYFNKLVKTDNNFSVTGFFLIVTTIVGITLLIVPIICLLVEIFYNHTISTDLSGMAAYITAVAGLFATGGITHAWSVWSTNKFGNGYSNTTPIAEDSSETTETSNDQ